MCSSELRRYRFGIVSEIESSIQYTKQAFLMELSSNMGCVSLITVRLIFDVSIKKSMLEKTKQY